MCQGGYQKIYYFSRIKLLPINIITLFHGHITSNTFLISRFHWKLPITSENSYQQPKVYVVDIACNISRGRFLTFYGGVELKNTTNNSGGPSIWMLGNSYSWATAITLMPYGSAFLFLGSINKLGTHKNLPHTSQAMS